MKRSHLVALLGGTALSLIAVAVARPSQAPAQPTTMTAADPTATPGAPGDRAEPAAPARSPEEISRRSQVYASVGELQLTVGEIEDSINSQQPFLRGRFSDPEKLREHADRLLRFELLAREAERREFDENPVVVRASKQSAVQHLIRTEFDEQITPESVTDEEVRAHYDANIAEFRRPEMARASHILVADEALARQLIEEAKEADVRAFRALARRHSIDTATKLRGGDLRYFTREGRPPGGRDEPIHQAIVSATFELEDVGDVAPEPIAVNEAFSVLKLTGRRAMEERAFENAAQGVRLRLWREKRQAAIEEFVNGLRRQLAPEVFADRMRAIHLAPVDPATGFQNAHGRAQTQTPEEQQAEAEAEEAAEPVSPTEM